MSGEFRTGVLTASAVLMVSTSAFAQVFTPPPPSAEPGRVEQRFRIEQRPEVGGAPLITLPDEQGLDKQLKDGATFTLKGVRFEELSAFSEEELKPIYDEYLGKEVSLKTLREITTKITAHYRNSGYILSRAVLPPQRLSDGVVTIRIIEGRVDNVRFEGMSVESGLLKAMADKIRNARPLSAQTLERYLLLMEDLPGVSARAVIQPSATTPGTSDVVINLSHKRFDGGLTADNRGSRFLGQYQGGATLNMNNIMGRFDRTTLRGIATAEFDELRYGEIVHEQQIGSEGTKIAVSASHTHTHPGSRLESLDIQGENRSYTVGISHPFIRSRQSNLFGNAEFDIRDSDVSSLGTKLYEDRLRVFRVGGAYDFVDRWSAINRMELNVSKGVSVWDTDSGIGLRSRTNGQPDFLKANVEITRLQPITGPFTAFVGVAGQLADDPLLAAEEFGLGGATYGSAYDPSEITGDHGVATRLELQYNDTTEWRFMPNYQVYTFYDIGKVWNEDPLPGDDSPASLASAGLGVRFNMLDDLSGGLEVAVPLTREVAANGQDGDDPRFFFSFAYRY